jgi:hypothetical protein
MSKFKNRQNRQPAARQAKRPGGASQHDSEATNLSTILGVPVLPYADSSRLKRLKRFRFQLLHDWLVGTFEPCRVADIGGGKGLLGYLMLQSGWDITVIDPFPQALPTRYKDIHSQTRVRIDEAAQIPYLQAEFEPAHAQGFDLLVAMHAHGCNARIIDAAAEYGCGFALFPCCVIDEPFFPPLGVLWVESLASYSHELGLPVSAVRLNFKGQNIGIYSPGRCRVRKASLLP